MGAWLPPEVRVVLLRAEGPSFSAGLDRAILADAAEDPTTSLLGLAAADPEDRDRTIAGFQSAFTWWREVPAVTVAVVQGHAVGAGFQLALACDLRVCTAAARFAMRETSLGLVPDLGGTAVLVALVGYARALELCATGRWVEADEAYALGLAARPVPPAQLDTAVGALVDALLAAPPDALRETKALLAAADGRSAEAQRAAERAAQSRLLAARAAGAAGA